MMLVIQTQVYENYGAHDWDGKGECPQYWKAKGGSFYKIIGTPSDCDQDEVVAMVRDDIEKKSSYFQETIIGYGLESDDYLSNFERSQLEYDGSIEFPEPSIEYSELVERSMA